MSSNSKMEAYYKKFIELQEKLRQSEEERLKLERKFNEMAQVSKEEEQTHYRKLRSQYKKFLEEDQKRQERNEKILRTLERIEARVNMLSSRTERFNMLRQQYQSYLQRISRIKPIEKRDHYMPKIMLNPPRDQGGEQHPTELELNNRSNKDQTSLKEAVGRSNDEKIQFLDRYLQNISSRTSKDTVENKGKDRQSESNRLKYFSDVTKKFDEGFNSNQANSIVEEIMNSIYSRHYKKEMPKDETKQANKFTTTNYMENDFAVKRNSEFGDCNKTYSVPNDYSNVAVLKIYQTDSPSKTNSSSKFIGDVCGVESVSNIDKFGERNNNYYEDTPNKIFEINEKEIANSNKTTSEKTLTSNVHLLQKQPYHESKYESLESNENSQIKDVVNADDIRYSRIRKMKDEAKLNEDDMPYMPSKTKIELNENEKHEFDNYIYCPVQSDSEIKQHLYSSEAEQKSYIDTEKQEPYENVAESKVDEYMHSDYNNYEPEQAYNEMSFEPEGNEETYYNSPNFNSDANYMPIKQCILSEEPVLKQQLNNSISDQIFHSNETTKENMEPAKDMTNYQVMQDEDVEKDHLESYNNLYHSSVDQQQQLYDEHGKLTIDSYFGQQIQYDDYGNQIVYDENNQPQQAQYVQQFNDSDQLCEGEHYGRLTEQEFIGKSEVVNQHNKSGQLINHYDVDIQNHSKQASEKGNNEDAPVNQQYAEDGNIAKPLYDDNIEESEQLVEQPYEGSIQIDKKNYENGQSNEQEHTNKIQYSQQPIEQQDIDSSYVDKQHNQNTESFNNTKSALVYQEDNKIDQLVEQNTERGEIDQQYNEDVSNEPNEYTENVDKEYTTSVQSIVQRTEQLVGDNDESQDNQLYTKEQPIGQLHIESEQDGLLKPETLQPFEQPDNESGGIKQQYVSGYSVKQVEYIEQYNDDSNYNVNLQYDESKLVEQQKNNKNPANERYDESGYVNQQPYSTNIDNQQYGETGQMVYFNDQQYDNSVHPTQQLYDENSQVTDQNIQQNKHDPSSLLNQQYDENGQPIYQYDENGQLIQQYDENGHPIISYNQTEQPILEYDENGQEILQYAENGQPIPQYSQRGNLGQIYNQQFEEYASNAIKQYDENGQPMPQYDESGQLLQVYDQDSQPLQSYDKNNKSHQIYHDRNLEAQKQKENEDNQNEYSYYQESIQSGHDLSNAKPKTDNLKTNIKDNYDHLSAIENNSENHQKDKNNVLDLLDTDTESLKQNISKVSTESDFDFSNG